MKTLLLIILCITTIVASESGKLSSKTREIYNEGGYDPQSPSNQMFNQEMKFYWSLTDYGRNIYDKIYSFMSSRTKQAYSQCFGNDFYITPQYCIEQQLKQYLYNNNNELFRELMTSLNIQKQYWNFANDVIRRSINRLIY
jgi:hypothetical protein